MVKLVRTIIFLFIFYSLGYTHFLGGPYWLARFVFVITVVGMLLAVFFFWRLKIFSKKISIKTNSSYNESGETIKVDAKIIE